MSNENISEDSSLCDRQPFDYVSCEGLRETRSCYHTRRSATAHWTNAPAPYMSQTTVMPFPPGGKPRRTALLLTPLVHQKTPCAETLAFRPGRSVFKISSPAFWSESRWYAKIAVITSPDSIAIRQRALGL